MDWNDSATLVFPYGGRWKTEDRMEELVTQQEEPHGAFMDIVQASENHITANNSSGEPNITAASWLRATLNKYSNLLPCYQEYYLMSMFGTQCVSLLEQDQ